MILLQESSGGVYCFVFGFFGGLEMAVCLIVIYLSSELG